MYVTFGTGLTVESKEECGNKNDPEVLSLAYWENAGGERKTCMK